MNFRDKFTAAGCYLRSACRQDADRDAFKSLFAREWEVFVVKHDPATGKYRGFAAKRPVCRRIMVDLPRRLVAEFLGTAMLLAVVVGSGIMAERLAGGNDAVALLANTIATGAALFALILSFSPISGAHFNPAVTLTELLAKQISTGSATAYVGVQIAGAVVGVVLANAMFGLPLINLSQKTRSGPMLALSEFVATFCLVLVIAASSRVASRFAVPLAVAAYISAAYWFTPSTSFANPAVAVARSLSDTFAGIRAQDVPVFAVMQLVGASGAFYLSKWLFDGAASNKI